MQQCLMPLIHEFIRRHGFTIPQPIRAYQEESVVAHFRETLIADWKAAPDSEDSATDVNFKDPHHLGWLIVAFGTDAAVPENLGAPCNHERPDGMELQQRFAAHCFAKAIYRELVCPTQVPVAKPTPRPFIVSSNGAAASDIHIPA